MSARQTVWIIFHEDDFESGLTVRAIYESRESAEAVLVTRTMSGKRSQSWNAHDENCCTIEEWDVQP